MRKLVYCPRFLVALLLFFCAGVAKAVPNSHVTAELVVEPSSIAPGQLFWVAVRLRMAPGWHTYYKEPGDIGLPTEIVWTLPSGFTASDIHWPPPKKFVTSSIVSLGYDGDVALLVKISSPKVFSHRSVIIQAKVNWLECQTECVPGSASLFQEIPVSRNPGPSPKEVADFFVQARKSLESVKLESSVGENSHDAHLRNTLSEAKLDNDEQGPPGLKKPVYRALFENTDQSPLSPEGGGKQPSEGGRMELAVALGLAFVGGVLLNLMPCVLPVLSIKVLGFLDTPKDLLRRHGLLYGVGVLVSFWALSGLLIFLRAGGEKLGWGFQLQSPFFVGAMALLFLVMGLNLWGLFEMGTSLVRLGAWTGKSSSAGAFLSGMLAVLVATPCTAPFMGPAMGYALAQKAAVSLAVFTMLGLGLAIPYVALTFFPSIGKLLPKPGAWMLILKRVCAVLFFATSLWLGWVFVETLGASHPSKQGRESFSEEKVERLLAEGRPVFVDFTAAWCITCQVNERTTLSHPSVAVAMGKYNVSFLVADWTHRDPLITRALERLGRSGVPVYVLFIPGRPPKLLPTLLTPDILLHEMSESYGHH